MLSYVGLSTAKLFLPLTSNIPECIFAVTALGRGQLTPRGEGTVLQKVRSDDASDTGSSFSLQSLCSTGL